MPSRPRFLACAALLALTTGTLGCPELGLPGSGAALFTSPQTNPVALSADGAYLYVANTTSGSVSVVDVSTPGSPAEVAEIKVGVDPVGIAVRPKASPGDDEYVYVTNHISDSISVISRASMDVVQTIQGIDPVTGVSTTDEPVGVVFAGPSRAFVALDNPNEILVIDVDTSGRGTIRPERLAITAQAPRALAVADGNLYVAAFESGNQTEFPSCDGEDTRGMTEGDPVDEGCEFTIRLVDGLDFIGENFIQNGVIIDFAAVSPNIGGRVIRDRDFPDRDLFVFDAQSLASVDVVEGVGTLLYGLATGPSGRLYVTNTEGRNQLDGLAALENRMFDNRLAVLDCGAAGCGAPTHVDLEGAANPLGVPVPTPYGVAVSGDGATLVVSVAGSDGRPNTTPGTPAGQADIPGLVTLDAAGNLLGAVQTGAIPQGLTLASDGAGAASHAYVLNTVASTLSVVDVSTPSAPAVVATLEVGSDPTPDEVREGRISFSTARASSSGNFSCESCHPNGNMDQLIWTINTVNGPDEGPDPSGEHAEPRTTMPIRGLRDTLPLHWDGTLGDPFGGPNGAVGEEVDLPPNCDINDEHSCFRHLANASLRGVMCDPAGGCATGVATDGNGGLLPGALDDAQRDALATFLGSVSYPPSPKRRPNDVLSDQANLGVQDFFTDEDGLGVGGGGAMAVGEAVNFIPITCADNSGGCHALPLTVATNSETVGAFEAPTIRGLWDRWVMFSNGLFNSEEGMALAQDCADGNPPLAAPGLLQGDPCTLDFGVSLRPGFPSGETVWDPAVGPTERGAWMASFEFVFDLAYGVPGANIWEFLNEMSVGLPGLYGRQVFIDPANSDAAETVAALAQVESAAAEGRITAVARNRAIGEMRYQPASAMWVAGSGLAWTGEQLRGSSAILGVPVTVTAELPENVSIGGADRQPLLDINPESRATEAIGDLLDIPRFPAGAPSTSPLGYAYVEEDAAVFVDGERCDAADGCSFTLSPGGGFEGADLMQLSLKALSAGTHVVQVQNPGGWFSNEMPVFAEEPAAP